jgi:hypothetical protein
MKLQKKNLKIKHLNFYRSLVATALLANGIFQLVAPVLADGTAAGQSISNTATATYEDPKNPGSTINATSNTVVVTVAEVAGITVTGTGVIDNNGNQVEPKDLLYYNYTVTNVGNDPTKFRIPEKVGIIGPGTPGKPEYSTDGGKKWIAITGTEYTTDSIPVGGSILVRVPVTVKDTAGPNDEIKITLGNTPGDGQNELRDANDGDVYTVDNTGASLPPGEVVGDPVNGTREASATQKAIVSQSLKSYPLATVLKARSDYNNGGTPATINDDKLTYDLSLRVELNDPTGNQIQPAPLAGRTITGFAEPRILVSDAIPKDTELAEVPTPPPGWQVVYTDQDPNSIDANAATWKLLTPSVDLKTVTRIGYVNDPAVIQTIAPGKTYTGFKVPIKVKSSVTATSLTVENIAQLFGQSVDGKTPVYDESGDQNPSNYDGKTIPPGTLDANGDGIPDLNSTPTVDKGYIPNPGTLPNTDIDGANNNSGIGANGEPNRFVIQVPSPVALVNGPERAPDAVGPTSNNDDFTNKSSPIPTDKKPGDTLDPAPVGFTNTVKNTGTQKNNISLVPTPPTNPADLPVNTTVRISYGSEAKTYVWTGTQFKYDADANPGTNGDQTAIDATSKYITIPNVDPNVSVNYGVEVNLPDGTKLSTDIDKGFPVPITAFIDDATPGLGADPLAEPRNITIDRVYTGYLKMVKESRVLPGTGPNPRAEDKDFNTNEKKPAPGNIIEYQIRYKNISDSQAGTGNVVLNADKVVITEDGTLSTTPGDGKNNWALDNDRNGQIDTTNVVGSAKDSGASTIKFYNGQPSINSGIDQSGTSVNSDVTKYVNTVTGVVAPGEERKFTFQRQVNKDGATGAVQPPIQ